MRAKLPLAKVRHNASASARLSVPVDTMEWVRALASSIKLKVPPDSAPISELKQYAWNNAIRQAILEISDRLLIGNSPKYGKASGMSVKPPIRSNSLPS